MKHRGQTRMKGTGVSRISLDGTATLDGLRKTLTGSRIANVKYLPPLWMMSRWQGGASLVHLLWHFNLGSKEEKVN